jgi:hypothetical protein
VRNQVFNVGSDDQNYTISEIGGLISRLVPTARIVSWATEADHRNYRVSFSKIRNRLEFVPRWTVEQGVRQVLEAFQTGRVRNYREAKYSNVKFLSEEGIFRLVRRDSNWAHELIEDTSAAWEPTIQSETVVSSAPEETPIAASSGSNVLDLPRSVAILGAKRGDQESLRSALARFLRGDREPQAGRYHTSDQPAPVNGSTNRNAHITESGEEAQSQTVDRRSGPDRRSGQDRRVGRGGWTGPERRRVADRRVVPDRRQGSNGFGPRVSACAS